MAVDLEVVLVDSNLNRKVRKPYALPSSLLNARGSGFLAGEFPGGITTVDGVPGPAQIRVLHRATGEVVAETTSAHNGTWRVEGLNPNMRFDVVGRKDGFNDVIVANVQPVNPPRLSGADKLTATVGKPFSHTVRAKGGEGSYTFGVSAGMLPSGLSLSNAGLLTGEPDIMGEYGFTVQVEDARGAKASKVVEVEVLIGARYWRINISKSNSHASVSELVFATTVGGGSVTIGGTVITSGSWTGAQHAASNAFDGVANNDSLVWASSDATSGWLGYDFGTPVVIREVRIHPRKTSQSPKTWTVEYSDDGVVWSVIDSQTNVTGWDHAGNTSKNYVLQ